MGIALVIVGVALQVIPGIGQTLGLAMIAGTGISTAAVIGLALTVAGNFLMGPTIPKGLNTSPMDRLRATLLPTTPRKIAFGETALGNPVRFK